MAFPNTPLTLLGKLDRQDVAGRLWENSWEEFFDLYHRAVRLCVTRVFHRYGWATVSEDHVEEVTLRVFFSLFRGNAGSEFDPAKGRFRALLSSICQRRVVDFIREHKNDAQFEPLIDETVGYLVSDEPFALREKEAFTEAVLGVLLTALRECVSPRVFMIFELVKLAGEDPMTVASELGVSRSVVDNSVFKAMKKLRELAASPEIAAELEP